jgi:cellobiose-specific phosphotransferase system component IIC
MLCHTMASCGTGILKLIAETLMLVERSARTKTLASLGLALSASEVAEPALLFTPPVFNRGRQMLVLKVLVDPW